MMKKSLVSIIVPIYNASRYLERCIDSLLAQNYHPLQIVLVDDGSTDNSGSICDAYAKRTDEVIAIHTQNQGVSSARNEGLKRADGEFIIFVDGDDEVSPYYVEHLMEPDDRFDYVAGGVIVRHEDGSEKCDKPVPCVYSIDTFRDKYVDLRESVPHTYVFAVRFSASIIKEHDLRFDSLRTVGEDEKFNIQYLLHCRNVKVIDSADYYYCQRNSGTVLRYHSDRIDQVRDGTKAFEEFNRQEGFERIKWFYWHAALQHYEKHLQLNDAPANEVRGRIRDAYRDPYFRNCIPYIMKNGTLDMKLEAFFLKIGVPRLFAPAMRVLQKLYNLKNKID